MMQQGLKNKEIEKFEYFSIGFHILFTAISDALHEVFKIEPIYALIRYKLQLLLCYDMYSLEFKNIFAKESQNCWPNFSQVYELN